MSSKKKYIIIGIILALIVLLIALSKAGVFGEKDNVTEVETAKANEITIVETVSATGKIQPEIEIKVSSQVSGEIIALPVKEGSVKRGLAPDEAIVTEAIAAKYYGTQSAIGKTITIGEKETKQVYTFPPWNLYSG